MNKIKNKKNSSTKLKISDIKHKDGAEVSHLLARVKAKEAQLVFVCVSICLIIILVSLYFVFTRIRVVTDYNVITSGNLSTTFKIKNQKLGNIVDLTPIKPLKDVEFNESDSYKMTVKNLSNKTQKLEIKLVKDLAMIKEDDCYDKQLDNSFLKYEVNNGEITTLDKEKDSVLLTDTLKANESREYDIKIWVSDLLDTKYLNYHYHGKLIVKNIKSAD